MRSLKGLSDNALLNNLRRLVGEERKLTHEILLFIIEVENRRIYRGLGYSSLFVFCTEGLAYSESAANRRICAARAIRKCPEAYDHLRDGRVKLGSLAIAWKHISPGLLDEIAGKTQRQVFNIVARFEPKIKFRDSARPVVVRQAVEVPSECLPSSKSPANSKLGQIHLRCGGKKLTTDTRTDYSGLPMGVDISTPLAAAAPAAPAPTGTETVRMHNINCLVEDTVMHDLDRCKELLSGKYPQGVDFNTLLKELSAEWLKKNDPVEREKRRIVSKKTTTPRRADNSKTSRYIPSAIRDAVYKRDGGRCAYIGADGKRCNSTWDLEIHHDGVPFARGGGHSIDNLKLLCGAHNRLEAEKVYGRKHIKKHDTIREATADYVVSEHHLCGLRVHGPLLLRQSPQQTRP